MSNVPMLTAVLAVLPVTLAGQASANPPEHETHHSHAHTASQRWRLYIQPSGKHDRMGATMGTLTLISPDGKHKLETPFYSGPWDKGALPGLVGDKDLHCPKHEHTLALNKPHVSYKIGKPIYNTGERWYESTRDGHTQKADFFLPLKDGDKLVVGRYGFGVHPNPRMRDGTQAGTAGCVGIPDHFSYEFEKLFKKLAAEGHEPKMLEVFTSAQKPSLLESKRHKHEQSGASR